MLKKTKIQYDTYTAGRVEKRLSSKGLTEIKNMIDNHAFIVNDKISVEQIRTEQL